MNWRPFLVLCALLLVLLTPVHAAGPVSYREIAMLLRNGEDPQFIIKETLRRKLLQPLSTEEEESLVALQATPALLATLRAPTTLASPEAAAAYAASVQQQKQRALQEEQLAAQAAAQARFEQQQKTVAPARPAPAAPAAPPVAGAGRESAGQPLTLKFTAADGSAVDLEKLRGKVVLVDFWATWCGPCMKEVPNVVAAYAKYHAKGFEVVGISLDQDRDAMLRVTAQKGMTWPQYFDGKGWKNEISTAFHINSIPTMWLVNKKGVVMTGAPRGNLDTDVARLLAE